ncbi:hypothetical protein STXM2123_352 [Streptomyces sp. F-3]|nr:hypothetical protein STXM2123_352 [Streptomyces sp. F-3]
MPAPPPSAGHSSSSRPTGGRSGVPLRPPSDRPGPTPHAQRRAER